MTGRGRREPSHEMKIQIVCGWPGQPDHGEQVLIMGRDGSDRSD
jgi:hypothetical protein